MNLMGFGKWKIKIPLLKGMFYLFFGHFFHLSSLFILQIKVWKFSIKLPSNLSVENVQQHTNKRFLLSLLRIISSGLVKDFHRKVNKIQTCQNEQSIGNFFSLRLFPHFRSSIYLNTAAVIRTQTDHRVCNCFITLKRTLDILPRHSVRYAHASVSKFAKPAKPIDVSTWHWPHQ